MRIDYSLHDKSSKSYTSRKQLIKVQSEVSVRTYQAHTVMEMLAHSHSESMFSSTALVYRRSHMCRFECNVRMCAEELLL